MWVKGTVRSAISASVLLAACIAVRADMPAHDLEYADTRALHSLVLEYFGPCQAGQFTAMLEAAGTHDCPALADAPGMRCLGDRRAVRLALARLIVEAGKVKQGGIDEFLARLDAGGFFRGHQVARYGGDYLIRLGVESGDGGRYLVSRHIFKDGRVAIWRFPLAGKR